MNQPNYNALIDEQTWAFIKKTESFFPSDAVELSIQEQRTLYNNMCTAFKSKVNTRISKTDHKIESRYYRTPTTGCLFRQYAIDE